MHLRSPYVKAGKVIAILRVRSTGNLWVAPLSESRHVSSTNLQEKSIPDRATRKKQAPSPKLEWGLGFGEATIDCPASAAMSNSQEKISVALCTYNGEPFLRQQLASIQQQTRLPDELVVCDDQSTDQTLTIVRQFAASAPYTVKIFENERNLGFAANFERAIRLCEGDLIALSDQDDIWYPNRLERSEQELTAHPEAGLVFSDADVINDNDELAGPTLWQRLGFAGRHQGELLARAIQCVGETQVCDRSYGDVPRRPARPLFAHRQRLDS